jgi:hypothetical protein
MAKEQGSLWHDYCNRVGRGSTCGMTSYYPVLPGSAMIAKSGSLGVSGFVRQPQAEGAITYVEYSYAIKTGFPVAKVLNSSGYYVEPTASSVAVALTGARINQNKNSVNYLTQILDGVYRNGDRRTYPLSSYSYMILPTSVGGDRNPMTEAKGLSLGTFARYFLCDGQQQAEELGYSPLPKNLVEAGFDQVRRVPGAPTASIDINSCRNPTFSGGVNTLIKNAPYPKACDKRGSTQCSDGTAGAKQTTPVNSSANGGGSSGSGGAGAAGGSGGGAGSTPGANGNGASSGGGAAGAGGAGGSGGGGAAGGQQGTGATGGGTIDPDTGEVVGDGTATGDSSVVAGPVNVGYASSTGVRGALMALSALLLLAVVLGPPITARTMAARARRRGGAS